MVSVSDIPIDLLKDRFINRERLEEIRSRTQRLPVGRYTCALGIDILCETDSSTIKHVAKVIYPGISNFFIHAKGDVEDLIRHVENADLENDFLIQEISRLSSELELMKEDPDEPDKY